MRRLVICIYYFIIVLGIKAQTDTTGVVKTYIEIYAMHRTSTPTIDTGEGKATNSYTTKDGDVIEFYSSIGAVNWFVSNGWKLESQHMATCNDRTIKMYIVSKEIPKKQAKAKQNNYINK